MNHSASLTTLSRIGRASAWSAIVLSQPWWPSPAISTIGWSVPMASRSETVGLSGHAVGRCPHPMTGRSGHSSSRARTSATASALDRAGPRSSRADASVHWPRWTCWSQSPGISQRPAASYDVSSPAQRRSDLDHPAPVEAYVDGVPGRPR